MKVEIVGVTEFFTPNSVDWKPEDRGTDWNSGDDLVEFGGRACYASWSRPNPKTASNQGYIANILAVDHGSVLEHANLSLYITGVSRSLTHELVRHRHLSPSQLSQRYVDSSDAEYIVPPLFEGDADAGKLLQDIWAKDLWTYQRLVEIGEEKLANANLSKTAARKQAREAARSVLPNMTETKLVLTGNARSWRHFVQLRGTIHADAEIRQLACEVLRNCKNELPNCFQDLEVAKVTPVGTFELVEVVQEKQ